jgi:hypothetical protein
MFRNIILFAFLFLTGGFLKAQDDSTNLSGTIKVNRLKDEKVYIKSYAKYRYELSEREAAMASDYKIFQPFPVVEGHAFPFNYSKFFTDSFKNEKILLKGKTSDTVKIEIRINAKGKVFLSDKTAARSNVLNLQCIHFLKEVKEWYPAYIIVPEKDVFRGQTVIKPEKKNVSSTGTITIVFSSEPFEN